MLAIAALRGRQHLLQLLWKPRHLSRMLRHQRERFDIEDEPVRCALRPRLRVTFRWQSVVCRVDFDGVELLGVKRNRPSALRTEGG
jgi:hypothetical protein